MRASTPKKILSNKKPADYIKIELQTTNQLDCNLITGHFLKAMIRILQGQNIAQINGESIK